MDTFWVLFHRPTSVLGLCSYWIRPFENVINLLNLIQFTTTPYLYWVAWSFLGESFLQKLCWLGSFANYFSCYPTTFVLAYTNVYEWNELSWTLLSSWKPLLQSFAAVLVVLRWVLVRCRLPSNSLLFIVGLRTPFYGLSLFGYYRTPPNWEISTLYRLLSKLKNANALYIALFVKYLTRLTHWFSLELNLFSLSGWFSQILYWYTCGRLPCHLWGLANCCAGTLLYYTQPLLWEMMGHLFCSFWVHFTSSSETLF